MLEEISFDMVVEPSENVVARNIEGQLIIVPLTGDMGDLEDALYTLNDTGRDIWIRLDGKKSLREIAEELATMYDAEQWQIDRDIEGLIAEFLNRDMIVVVSPD